VEAEHIKKVVTQFGPCQLFGYLIRIVRALSHRLATKVGAIVAGQTSVKAPERAAFEQHLPEDVHIVSCHSLHGPTVPTKGQPLVRLFPGRSLMHAICPPIGPDQASSHG
jgi:prephenate dehydrogenase (NADP+)